MKESRSESITVRVPSDLMKAVRERAIALGMGETENDISVSEVVKAALKTFVGIDSDSMSNTVSDNVRHRLESLEVLVSAINLDALKSEILKDVELLIANIPSGQAVVRAIASPENLSMINNISQPETRHNQLDLTDIPAIAVSPEIVQIDAQVDLDHPYPVGTELRLKELSEYLGFNLINHSTYAKKKGISKEDYINRLAIAKGELWRFTTVGTRTIAVRVS
jgi:hypothetical protein